CNAADVIVVLVRDDDGGKRLGLDADPREPRGRIANAETAVDQNASGTSFDNEPVAFAAAADRREAHQGTSEQIPRGCNGLFGLRQNSARASPPSSVVGLTTTFVATAAASRLNARTARVSLR